VVAGNPSVTWQTAQTRGVQTADPDPAFKMSGKLAVGVARDSQIFSEHQGASRGHLCDSMASCSIKFGFVYISFLTSFVLDQPFMDKQIKQLLM